MPGAGDLVTVLSMDVTRFQKGAAVAKNEMKQMQAASGNMGRSFTQVGFAAQDFFSILEMGGKNAVGRALMSTMNNVQMLGMAFGPWGMAITSVGGALASMLIPRLFEATKGNDDLAKSIENSTKAMNGQIEAANRTRGFMRHLNELAEKGSVEDVKKEQGDVDAKIEDLEDEIKRRQAELRNTLTNGPLQQGGIGFNAAKPLFGADDKLLQNITVDADKLGEDAAKKIQEQQQEIEKKRGDLLRFQNRKNFLGKALPFAEQNDRRREEERQHEKDLDELEGIRKKSRTPQQVLEERLKELNNLGARTPGNEHLVAAGMDEAFKEFERSLPKEMNRGARLASGATAGSASAISAINQASAQKAADVQTQQLQQAKQQVDLAKQQLTQLQNIAKNENNQPQPVALGG